MGTKPGNKRVTGAGEVCESVLGKASVCLAVCPDSGLALQTSQPVQWFIQILYNETPIYRYINVDVCTYACVFLFYCGDKTL